MHAPTRPLAEPATARRTLRRSLLALVLSALLLPFASLSPSVVRDVDARRLTIGATVAEALEVEVRVNGAPPIGVISPDATVDGALRAAGLGPVLATDPVTVPARDARLTAGDVIEVMTPLPLTIVVPEEGLQRREWTSASTVGEALRLLDVDLSLLDRVDPSPDQLLVAPTTIRIARVTMEDESREVVLPRSVRRVDDPKLLRGVVRVQQAGKDGLQVDTDRVLRVEGVEESRLLLSSETVREPVERIERHGVMEQPPATVWDDLARCESGSRWDIVRRVNSDISYHGGLQFLPRTWSAFRPSDFPELASEATREQQIAVAQRVQAAQGWRAWPACARRLGLR